MRKFQVGDVVTTIGAAADWRGDQGVGKKFRGEQMGNELIVAEIGDLGVDWEEDDKYYVKLSLPGARPNYHRFADRGATWEYCPESVLIPFGNQQAAHVWTKGDRVRIVAAVGPLIGRSLRMDRAVGKPDIYIVSHVQHNAHDWYAGNIRIKLEGWGENWDTPALQLVPDNEWREGDLAYVVGQEPGYGPAKRRMRDSELAYQVVTVVVDNGTAYVVLRDPETGRSFTFSERVVSHYADGPRKIAVIAKPPEEKEEEVEERLRKEFDKDIIDVRKSYNDAGGFKKESLAAFYIYYKPARGKTMKRMGSLGEACHYNLKAGYREPAPIEILGGINFLTTYEMEEEMLPQYKRYLDYVLNRGHAKNAFYRTSVEGAIENGLRYNVERGINELALASVAVRMGTEFSGRLPVFCWALDNGYSENVAAALFHCVASDGGDSYNVVIRGGHQVLSTNRTEDVFKFFSDKWEFVKEEPYRLVNKAYTISSLIGEYMNGDSLAEDVEKVLDVKKRQWGASSSFSEDKLKVLATWFKKGIENV